jgi:hypothetical protein
MSVQRRCRRCGNVATIAYPKIHCAPCTRGLFLPLCAPSAIPLTIVCGPSGAGKSTLVDAFRAPGDIVIDLDAIKEELTGLPRYADLSFSEAAFLRRNDMLAELSRPHNLGPDARAWFIVQAPTKIERRHWRETLQPQSVTVLEVPMVKCMDHIIKDPRRSHQSGHWVNVVIAWWEKYEKDSADVVLTEIPAALVR